MIVVLKMNIQTVRSTDTSFQNKHGFKNSYLTEKRTGMTEQKGLSPKGLRAVVSFTTRFIGHLSSSFLHSVKRYSNDLALTLSY